MELSGAAVAWADLFAKLHAPQYGSQRPTGRDTGRSRGPRAALDGNVSTAMSTSMNLASTLQADIVDSVVNDWPSDFIASTWNACGMEDGAVNDMVVLLDSLGNWDAVLIQEGPFAKLIPTRSSWGGTLCSRALAQGGKGVQQ